MLREIRRGNSDNDGTTSMVTASGIMRRTTGCPPWLSARLCERALPTSCSIGRKHPGARENAINHMATIGLKPSCPRACWPILKNTIAEIPAINRPTPTVSVPSGRGILLLVGCEADSSDDGCEAKVGGVGSVNDKQADVTCWPVRRGESR